MPGSGDGVQAIKAGLMEIPDVLAVTKADRQGADALVSELRNALALVPAGPWEPPIVRVSALEGEGLDELWAEVERHRAFLAEDDRLDARRRDGLARQLRALAADRLARRVDAAADPEFVDAPDRRRRSAAALDPAGGGRPAPGERGSARLTTAPVVARVVPLVAQDQRPDDQAQHQHGDHGRDQQRPPRRSRV